MNALVKAGGTLAISDDEAIKVLSNSLYPGARPESIRLVLAWCKATGRDPMKKPIHIVPMWVKDAITGNGAMRDVLMPGIGTYRSDASTTGQYAGKGEPEFGPDVVGNVGTVRMTYPKWCKVSVSRVVAGKERSFTAMEFWLENYATAGRDKDEPNAMWRKRPYGQLAKCAESQALRMAFPDETGNTNTIEEMEGKTFSGPTIDAEPEVRQKTPDPELGFVDKVRSFLETETNGTTWLKGFHKAMASVETIGDVMTIMALPSVRAKLDPLKGAPTLIKQQIDEVHHQTVARLSPQESGADEEVTGLASETVHVAPSASSVPGSGQTPPVEIWPVDEMGEPLDDQTQPMSAVEFANWFAGRFHMTHNQEGLQEHNIDNLGEAGADQTAKLIIMQALGRKKAADKKPAVKRAANGAIIPNPPSEDEKIIKRISAELMAIGTDDEITAWSKGPIREIMIALRERNREAFDHACSLIDDRRETLLPKGEPLL